MKRYIFILFLFLPVLAFSQFQFGVHGGGGYSNFVRVNKVENRTLVNRYARSYYFNAGGDVYYNLFFDLQLLSGLDFSCISVQPDVDDYFFEDDPNGKPKFDKQFFTSLRIPMKLNYNFTKWLAFHIGFTNTFYLTESKKRIGFHLNTYNISFHGGLDFRIMQQFVIGVEYHKDKKPTIESKKWGAHTVYFGEHYGIKLGYLFPVKNKKK